MLTLLRKDSSARAAGSRTKRNADAAEIASRVAHQDSIVVPRHIGTDPAPALTQDSVAGFFTAPEDITHGPPSASGIPILPSLQSSM